MFGAVRALGLLWLSDDEIVRASGARNLSGGGLLKFFRSANVKESMLQKVLAGVGLLVSARALLSIPDDQQSAWENNKAFVVSFERYARSCAMAGAVLPKEARAEAASGNGHWKATELLLRSGVVSTADLLEYTESAGNIWMKHKLIEHGERQSNGSRATARSHCYIKTGGMKV